MFIRIVTISLILFILSIQLTLAQSPTPSPQQAQLIEAIQQRAQKDVELGKSVADITDLNVLFGEEARQMGLSIREVLDIYETAYAEAKPETPWWHPFLPNIGWGVAIIFFFLFILRDVIQTYATKFFEAIWEAIYKRLSGTKLLRWQALRRYCRALVEKYETLKIPFRSDHPLVMAEVYVPLKVAETHGQEIDAMQAIRNRDRLMVIGEPGSGKSVFLRRLALAYTQGELDNIPILLELHRLAEATDSLQTALIDVLARNDFPNAKRFVQVGLEYGLFILLFDGLDEVPSDQRKRVVQQIKDLLDQYNDCQVIITCRSAVYHGEFDNWADQKLEIIEFSDQQIQHFLASWAGEMPSGKSVDQLLHNLRERPRIMALARNPLLLTIIAYLYTDTPFVLPHSRAEFYDKSITVLLEQWKEKRNQYKASHKRLILQHLALFNQDNTDAGNEDRRSIDLTTVLHEIKRVLPSLTLRDEDTQSILDEIVERSGLLLAIDAGTKYQFTHLTLQEFFAAQALEADEQALLARFQRDPDAWLETIKLWCGLAHDSTRFVEAVYAQNPVVGFECLADAQKIEAKVVDKVLAEMQSHLQITPVIDGAIIRAFAAVAADPRPRGQALFEDLSQMLGDESLDAQRRLHIASILARTNLPQAAKVLAQYAATMSNIRSHLVQMGDLAVPSLMQPMTTGDVWRLDALHDIGTPRAAMELAGLIWESGEISYHAAWRLAALLPKTGVEEALQHLTCTSAQRKRDKLGWVWVPFDDDVQSSLSVIAGRVAHLLHTSPANTLPAEDKLAPDPRLIIPLCTVAVQPGKWSTLTELSRKELGNKIERPFGTVIHLEPNLADLQELATEITNKLSHDTGWRYLIKTLPFSLRFELLQRLALNELKPSQNDWRNLFQPVEYQFAGSWHEWGVKLALVVIGVLGFWPTFAINFSLRLFVSGLAVMGAIWLLRTKHLDTSTAQILLVLAMLLGGLVVGILGGTSVGGIVGAIAGAIAGAIGGVRNGNVAGAIAGAGSVAIGGAMSGANDYMIGVAIAGAIGVAIGSVIGGVIGGTIVGASIGVIGGMIGGYSVTIAGAIVGAIVGAIAGASFFTANSNDFGGTIVGASIGVIGGVIPGAIGGMIGAIYLFQATEFFLVWGRDWPIVVLLWVIWFAVFSGLTLYGSRRERLAQNLLQGLLDDQKRQSLAKRKFWLLGRIP